RKFTDLKRRERQRLRKMNQSLIQKLLRLQFASGTRQAGTSQQLPAMNQKESSLLSETRKFYTHSSIFLKRKAYLPSQDPMHRLPASSSSVKRVISHKEVKSLPF